MLDNKTIGKAMTIKLGNELPEYPEFDDSKRRPLTEASDLPRHRQK